MGIGDYIWPFSKKFSEIPCAREAAIAGLLGGPALGAGSIILTGRVRQAFKTSVYSGFAVFWISFVVCRYQYAYTKRLSKEFYDAYKAGKID